MGSLGIDARKFARRLAEPLAYATDGAFVKPTSITLSLTNRCNLRCPTCAYWKTPDSEKANELTLEEMKRLLVQLREWLGPFQLGLTGGEPFLRNEIFDLIRECDRLGIKAMTVTNGSLLPKRRIDQLLEVAALSSRPLDLISFSLNHLDPAKHNETRGSDSSAQKILQAIEQLNLPGRTYRMGINAILMGYNIDHAPEMVRWVADHRLNGITFQILYFESGNSDYEPGWFAKSPYWDSDTAKIDRGIDALIALKKARAPITNSTEQMEWMRRYLKDPEAPINIPCKVGVAHFDIDANGDVRLCDIMGSVGNVRNSHPKDLWTGESARSRREEIHACEAACRIKSCNFRRPLTTIIAERLRGG